MVGDRFNRGLIAGGFGCEAVSSVEIYWPLEKFPRKSFEISVPALNFPLQVHRHFMRRHFCVSHSEQRFKWQWKVPRRDGS